MTLGPGLVNFSIKKVIATSQLTLSSAEPLVRRIMGWVPRRSLLFATQAYFPFGPRWPRFTGWSIAPLMPAMRPSFTATSTPQPFEHSRHAECTQQSGSPSKGVLQSWRGSIEFPSEIKEIS